MSIRDFHSRLISGGERSSLFVALHRLSRLDEPRKMIAFADAADGWPRWDGDPAGPPPEARL